MEKTFKSPGEFATYLNSMKKFSQREETKEINKALRKMSEFLEIKVKEKFGHYQSGWEKLSNATQTDRQRLGFSPNDPLLRTGELRDSVKYTVYDRQAIVGSTSEIMVYQELGTSKTGWKGAKGIPPRPIFKLTKLLDSEEAIKIFMSTLIESLRVK